MSDAMPIETASLFFVDDTPRAALAALLRALEAQHLLADTQVDADPRALTDDAALGALFHSGHAPLDAFLDALVQRADAPRADAPRADAQRASAPAYFYVRLAAPSALPQAWRAELEAKLGELADADALAPIHPYELVVAFDLVDADHKKTAELLSRMRHRAHPHLPAALRMVDTHGEPIAARAGFELRCPPETVGVLAFVLEKAGLLAGRLVLVRVLD